MIVYKITNWYNGKVYVGQTKFSVEKRFKEHAKADSLIGRAIRKYGAENFSCEVLATCETRAEAYDLEIYFIRYFNCMSPNGYNLTEGGLYANFEMSFDGETCIFIDDSEMLILIKNAPISALRVFGVLASKQNYYGGIKITKRALAEELDLSRTVIWQGFKWLQENNYIKQRKIDGITEILLNPNVTTCGKNRKEKLELWSSL